MQSAEDGKSQSTQSSAGFFENFHNWYSHSCCSHTQVNQLLRVQNLCGENSRFWQTYFLFWTTLGDAPFYTLMCPVLIWTGLEREGWALVFFMGLNTLITGILKDKLRLPRPPSPPLRRENRSKVSHGFEYGFPSTHSAVTASLCWEIYLVLESLYPKERPIIIGIMSFCFFNIVYSRLYLGLHWIGDIMGGFAVWGVIAVMESFGLRSLVMHWVDVSSVPYVVPFALAHIVCLTLPIPQDPCACYEDSCRFVNVCASAIVGYWMCRANGIRGPSYDPNELWWFLCSWAFVKRYVFGVIIVLIFKTLASKFSPKLLRPVHKFFCGTKLESIPRSLQRIYIAACMIWGLMLGKKIQRNGDFTSDSHDPHFSASAELVDSAVAAGVGNADTASIFARHRNQMWSLRNHKWWFEWDIHSKYVTYYVTGLFITFVVPAAHMAVFGSQEAVVVPAE